MADNVSLGANPAASWRVSAASADLVRRRGPTRPLAVAAEPKPITIDLARTARRRHIPSAAANRATRVFPAKTARGVNTHHLA